MTEPKASRRSFLGYAATAIVVGVVAGVGGYYAGLLSVPPETTPVTTTITQPPVTTTITSTPKERLVRIASGSRSPTVGPVYVAMEGGFFRKYGLKVELTHLKGAAATTRALVSGDVDISWGSLGGIAGAEAAEPVGIRQFCAVTPGLQLFLTTRPEIEKIDAATIKGKIASGTSRGSMDANVLVEVLDKIGVGPDDVAWVMISHPDIAKAMIAGKVDIATLAPPFCVIAENEGMKLWGAAAEYGAYPRALDGLNSKLSYIQASKDVIVDTCKAIAEASYYMYRNEETTTSILMKWIGIEDREVMTKSYGLYSNNKLWPDGSIALEKEWVEAEIARAALANPAITEKNLGWNETVYSEAWEELERTGFYNTLESELALLTPA